MRSGGFLLIERHSRIIFGAFLFSLTIAILLSEVLAANPQTAPFQALPTTTTTSSSVFTSATTTYTTLSTTITTTSTYFFSFSSLTTKTSTFSTTTSAGTFTIILTSAVSGILTVTSTYLGSSASATVYTQLMQIVQTSTIVTRRTLTRSVVLQSPGIPSFFPESIFVGLALGLLVLLVIRRSRRSAFSVRS